MKLNRLFKNLVFLSILLIACNCFASEVLSGTNYKDEVVTLNEELRKMDSQIQKIVEPASDDTVSLSNGTEFEAKVLPNCSTALIYNSSTNTFSCAPPASLNRTENLTGASNWTVPDGVTTAIVTMVGGGGGGAGSKAGNYSAAGGGGGATIYGLTYSVTPGASISYSVGAAGSAGVGSSGSYGGAGGNGGNTTFASFTANGGEGGPAPLTITGGAGGSDPVDFPGQAGGNGGDGVALGGSCSAGGVGGSSFYAAGGTAPTSGVCSAGTAGTSGSGGSGSSDGDDGAHNGGAGGAGVITIRY